MEEALIAKLLATAGITAAVGQRVTWKRRGQGKPLPAIVLHRIDGGRDYHHGGPSGLIESRVQVDCWGDTYLSAKNAARAVEAALSGARFDQDGIRFDAILIVDERDDTSDENGKPLYRTSLDLMVHHATA
jgi:hypothetical protein